MTLSGDPYGSVWSCYPVARKSIKNLKGLSPLMEDPVGDAITFVVRQDIFVVSTASADRLTPARRTDRASKTVTSAA